MSVGPQSIAVPPRQYADKVLSGLSAEVCEQVLHGTAAKLYGLS